MHNEDFEWAKLVARGIAAKTAFQVQVGTSFNNWRHRQGQSHWNHMEVLEKA